MKLRLAHPDRITVSTETGPFLGFNQEWFPIHWQRMAGCGPTTGAVLTTYRKRKETGRTDLTKDDAIAEMLAVLPYATPRAFGLWRTHWLADGLRAYLASHALSGRVEALSVPPLSFLRPSEETLFQFLSESLSEDSPIAFLNRHSGGDASLPAWHWMPLVTLSDETGTLTVTLWDEGKEIFCNLSRWRRETKFGGGFVRIMN